MVLSDPFQQEEPINFFGNLSPDKKKITGHLGDYESSHDGDFCLELKSPNSQRTV